jgi:hypothetical protein
MHAIVVRVTVNDREAGEKLLREQVVPQVSGAPGFVAGYWTRRDNSGLSMLVFESEEAAQAVAGQIESPDATAVTIEGVEVREVVAHA